MQRRKIMKKIICKITVGLVVMASAVIATAQQENTSPFGVQHRLIPAARVNNPTPPSGVSESHQSSIGQGRVAVHTAQPGSFWQEQIAIGGSYHAVVTTDFLYDSNLGIVYAYRDGDFACKNGQTESGRVLEARYTRGNKAGEPVGSGWYAVDLKAGKCGAKESGVYGCKLDSSATATQCGATTINSQTGEIDLVAAQ